jgi:hypothetical protein
MPRAVRLYGSKLLALAVQLTSKIVSKILVSLKLQIRLVWFEALQETWLVDLSSRNIFSDSSWSASRVFYHQTRV